MRNTDKLTIARFSTDPRIVTGDTPDELETKATAGARAATGLPGDLLEPYTPYTLFVTADYGHLADSQVNEAVRAARRDGSKLAAKIAVVGYQEVSAYEPCTVAGGPVRAGDSADLCEQAGPALDSGPDSPLEDTPA